MLSIAIEIINDKLKSLQICEIILFDLRKAFDTLDHTILLHKRYMYGIRGIAFNLIKSYLSEREQCVSQNGKIQIIIILHVVFHKDLFLDHFYLFYILMNYQQFQIIVNIFYSQMILT